MNTNRYENRSDGTVCITTKKGHHFLIDAADVDIARQHCWFREISGYARADIWVDGKSKAILLHRLLCATTANKPLVDHANADNSDNRRSNLRPCTRAENAYNSRRRRASTNRYKGVAFNAGKFQALVRVDGRQHYLGRFLTAEEAASVARAFREKHHGEFARHT